MTSRPWGVGVKDFIKASVVKRVLVVEGSGTQSRINIGSDGTLARAPVGMGLKRCPQIIFWGPYLLKYYKTEYKVQKNKG